MQSAEYSEYELVNNQPSTVCGAGKQIAAVGADGSISPSATITAAKKLSTGGIQSGVLTAPGGHIQITTGGTAEIGVGATATSVDGLLSRDADSIVATGSKIIASGNIARGGVGTTVTGTGTTGGADGSITFGASEGGIGGSINTTKFLRGIHQRRN